MRRTLFVLVGGASLIAGCGGGGGSDAPPVVPVGTSATVALSGTAAKGLMAGADVDVFAVKADGTVDSASLAHTTTNAAGAYSLSFAGTKDQPYVVRVSANAGTTHLDEVSNTAQPLPAGFAMRSLVTPTATGADRPSKDRTTPSPSSVRSSTSPLARPVTSASP